jgi:hypothetical protein
MKYVDENAWAELLGAIKDGTLLSQDATARTAALAKLPQLAELNLPPPVRELDFNALKATVDSLTDALREANDLELGLANLGYFFQLAGQSWQSAYKRVGDVTSRESAKKFLTRLPGRLLLFAVQTGLSMLTAGGAALLYNLIAEPIKASLEGQWNGYEDAVTDASKEGIKGILDVMVSVIPGTNASVPTDGMVDPATVFSNYEGTLRKTAVELRSARAQKKQLVGSLDLEKKLVAAMSEITKDGDFAKFILEKIDTGDIDPKWQMIARVLDTIMLRAAWTQYCRSNWTNITYDYTIAVKSTDEVKTSLKGEDDPRKWPSNVWDSVNGWPEYWGDICADFCGLEHRPGDKLNEKKTPAQMAAIKVLESRMAWISMAAVECCQVQRRFSPLERAKKFDLKPFPLPPTNPPNQLKASELFTEAAWKDAYKPYRSKQDTTCQIAAIRFSLQPSIAYGVPTGKRGRHDTPYSAAAAVELGGNTRGFAGCAFGVILKRSDKVSTEQVTLNWAALKVSAADARTVTHWRNGNDSFQFNTNKKDNNGKDVSTVIKPAVFGPIWTTRFTTGPIQTKTLKFGEEGLYAFWLSTMVIELELSDDVWYVWVVAPPK